MNPMTALDLVQGRADEHGDMTVLNAWQYLVDTGLAWTLEGAIGRQAASLIDLGLINN